MKIPWIVHASAASQVLVPLAWLRHGRALSIPRRWIVVWGLVIVLGDAIALPLALHARNNLWVSYVSGPLEVAATLMALAHWHATPIRRMALRLAAAAFALVELVLLARYEQLDSFSVLIGPLKALLLLAAAVLTLLACVRRHEGDLLREDWLWICLGLSLRYGSTAAIDPLSALLAPANPAVLLLAFKTKAWVVIFASLAIAWGILCPIPLPPSSRPSLPASSPSPSSWSPSGLPS